MIVSFIAPFLSDNINSFYLVFMGIIFHVLRLFVYTMYMCLVHLRGEFEGNILFVINLILTSVLSYNFLCFPINFWMSIDYFKYHWFLFFLLAFFTGSAFFLNDGQMKQLRYNIALRLWRRGLPTKEQYKYHKIYITHGVYACNRAMDADYVLYAAGNPIPVCESKTESRNSRDRELQQLSDASILNANLNLEITKNGNLRSEAEIVGIARKKFDTRNARKKFQQELDDMQRKTRAKKDWVLKKQLAFLEDFDPFVNRTPPITEKSIRKKQRGNRKRPETESLNSFIVPAVVAALNIDSTFTKFAEKYKFLGQVIVYFASLMESKNEYQDGLATAQFLLGTDTTLFASSVALWSSRLASRRRNLNLKLPETESLSEILSSLAEGSQMLMNSQIIQSIRNIILTVVSYKLFSKDIAKNIKMLFGTISTPMNAVDAFAIITSSLSSLVKMGELWSEGAPMSQFLKQEDPLNAALIATAALERSSTSLYYGLPVPGRMCARAFMQESKGLAETLEYFLKKSQPLSAAGKEIASKLQFILNKRLEISKVLLGQNRQTPMGICLTGPPGIGKSSIMNLIYQIWSHVKGRVFDPSHVFHRVMSSQYWETFDPESQVYGHWSEVGCEKDEVAIRSDNPALKEILSVLDSAPMPVNMADLATKGKNFCLFEMLMIDTNNSSLNAHLTHKYASAVYRRMIFVEPRVKKEFKKEGGNTIDPNVPCANYYDKWHFRVYIREPINEGRSFKETDLMNEMSGNDDVYAFEQLLTELIKRHTDNQVKHVEEMNMPVYEDGKFLRPDYYDDFGKPETDIFHDYAPWDCEGKDNDTIFPTLDSVGEKYFNAQCAELDDSWTDLYDLGVESGVEKTEALDMVDDFIDHRGERLFGFTPIKIHPLPIRFFISLWLILSCLIAEIRDLLYAFWCLALDYLSVKTGWSTRAIVALPFMFFMMWLNLEKYFMVFGIICVSQFKLYDFMKSQTTNAVFSTWDELKARSFCVFNRVKSLGNYFTGKYDKRLVFAAKVVVFLGGLTFAVRKYKSWFKKSGIAESSNFPKNPTTDRLHEFEDEKGCGKGYARVYANQAKVWNHKELPDADAHKSDTLSLFKSVSRNIRHVKIDINDDEDSKTFALGISGSYLLINRHAVKCEKDTVKLSICTNSDVAGPRTSLYVHLPDCVVVKDDIILIDTNMQFSNIIHHFPVNECEFMYASGFVAGDPIVAQRTCTPILVNDHRNNETVTISSVVTYPWENHGKGKCGNPVVANRTGSSSCIVGLHTAGAAGVGYATHILQSDITSAIERHSAKNLAKINDVPIQLESYDMPSHKSLIRHESVGVAQYFGKIDELVLFNQKSKLTKTVLSPTLDEAFYDTFGWVRTEVYDKPVMSAKVVDGKYINPYNRNFRKMVREKRALDPQVLAIAVEQVSMQIIANLKKRKKFVLQPLDMNSAINGIIDDYFVRRLDMKKGAGFGTVGKKEDYVDRQVIDGVVTDIPKPELIEAVLEILESYDKSISAKAVFRACLKDEPRLAHKVADGATRVFFQSAFAHLIAQRMLLLPIYSLMIQYSNDFYVAIGTDMHRDSHRVYHRLVNHSSHILEGDYAGFDTGMPVEVGRAANSVVINILREFGYDEKQMRLATSCLSDNLFPYIDYVGEMICVAGLQPSGKFATAEDNSIRNLIIMVYLWNSIPETKHLNFFEEVLAIIYGDDVLAAVSSKVAKYFNAVTFSQYAKELMGLEFTSSAKGLISQEFVLPEEMSFLKRTFSHHVGLNRIVGKLDLNSIYKSLEWSLPSQFINAPTQLRETCVSALREIFFHCDSTQYGFFRAYLIASFENHYPAMGQISLPQYEDLMVSLEIDESKDSTTQSLIFPSTESATESKKTKIEERFSVERLSLRVGVILRVLLYLLFVTCVTASKEEIGNPTCAFSRAHDWYQRLANQESNQDLIDDLTIELRGVEYSLRNIQNPFPCLTYHQVRQLQAYSTDEVCRDHCDVYFALACKRDALQLTINKLWFSQQRNKSNQQIFTESETVSEMTKGPFEEDTKTVHENVVDIAGTEIDEKSVGTAFAPQIGQKNLLDVSDFFSRPIAIYSQSLALSTDLTLNMDIWTLYLSQPSVRAKLKNYAYARFNLNIRITVSGTPFHRGLLIASYQPLEGWNDNLTFLNTLAATPNRFMLNSYLSQSRWCRTIDVKENKPLEMMFPFIGTQPVFRLFNASPLVLAAGDDYDDAVDFGHLHINTLNQIKSVSSTPSEPTLFVYAWASDIELGSTTGTVIEVSTESATMKKKKNKRKQDEREAGPIERFASSVSKYTGYLTEVPEIGPFAEAASFIAGGVATVASWFGFSVATVINEPIRVRPEPFQNGCQTTGFDTGQRISLDPKQALTVDPRVMATSDDELAIPYLCDIESLFDTFTWSKDVTPLTTSIWLAPVTPYLFKRFLVTGSTYMGVPTPLAYTAALYEYWRGKITYRFQFVVSSFHRGKIALLYEPNISQNVVIDTTLYLNKQQTWIVDLAETQELTVTVDWAFAKPWARNMTTDLFGDLGQVGYLGDQLIDFANGYFAVVPFTTLQSPDDSDIEVNVYVSSSEMVFNQMSDTRLPTERPQTESDTSPKGAGSLSPEDSQVVILNPSSANMDHIGELYFGEFPGSLRAALHRFTGFQNYFALDKSAGETQVLRYQSLIIPPPFPVYASNDPSTHKSLYGYLRYAFIGLRGGIRHRVGFACGIDNGPTDRAKISLVPPDQFSFGAFVTSADTLHSNLNGTIDFVPLTNGGFEFECPFYTNNAFGISFHVDPFPSSNSMINEFVSREFKIIMSYVGSANANAQAIDDAATGDDHVFMGFQGAPPFSYTN